uniref:DUF659 domain-containing protein n=1 Tax=Amphimedon queenslandica TaxID=400682 RepID=A0A1X7VXR6_AMPQE
MTYQGENTLHRQQFLSYTRVFDINSVASQFKHIYNYAATTDLWSSYTMEPSISLTVHFINEEWEHKSRCLQTMFKREDHTGSNISEALTQAMQQWELNNSSLVCITTDNGSNMILASDILGWNRISCFGHNLHLAVTNSVKGDDRVTKLEQKKRCSNNARGAKTTQALSYHTESDKVNIKKILEEGKEMSEKYTLYPEKPDDTEDVATTTSTSSSTDPLLPKKL